MKQQDKKFLLACAIGDGYITKQYNNNNARLVLQHSEKQKEYLSWKREKIAKMFDEPIAEIQLIKQGKYAAHRWSKSHPFFNILRTRLYENEGKKQITSKILSSLDTQGLAILWMDDGSMYVKKRNEKVVAREGILSLYGTKHEVTQWALALNQRFQLDFKIVKHRTYYRLRLNTAGCRVLSTLIEPFMCPSMKYKIIQCL